MKKHDWLFLIAIFFSTAGQGQITKGNWLVGGSGSFSSARGKTISSLGIQKGNHIQLSVAPDFGYFFLDKLAVGLKPTLDWRKSTYGNLIRDGVSVAGGARSNTPWLDLGPFLRYYFFAFDSRLNFFTEANYKYGRLLTDVSRGGRYSYSFYGGPVIFFNSSVAIELALGYKTAQSILKGENARADDYTNRYHSIEIGLGLQIHLENH